MGRALIFTSGYALNPGAALTAVTAQSGDSLTVPAFVQGTQAVILAAYHAGATAGVMRLRSPRFHDLSQGIRLQRKAADTAWDFPYGPMQPLYPADTLIAELTGGGAETDVLGFLSYFADLPGITARLALEADVTQRIRNVLGVEVDPTTGATVGAYGAGRAINADFDTLKANTDYALIGYVSQQALSAVAISGPDTGNYRIGWASTEYNRDTARFFFDLSRYSGLPTVPIVNANNRGATLLYAAQRAAAGAVQVSLILGELAP